jgi:hypothetical protein
MVVLNNISYYKVGIYYVIIKGNLIIWFEFVEVFDGFQWRWKMLVVVFIDVDCGEEKSKLIIHIVF